MAAPHVTGAMALIYDAWRKREGGWPTEEEAVSALMKHIRKVKLDYRLVGEGMLDLTWSNLRWPLYRLQLGAFYNKGYCDAKAAELKTKGLDTYKVKY
jgi:major intracellular serine protease